MDIEEGNVVTLKSGSVEMVAEQILANEVKCVWQDNSGKICREKFYSSTLNKKVISSEDSNVNIREQLNKKIDALDKESPK